MLKEVVFDADVFEIDYYNICIQNSFPMLN
jgi:hypothetical protein